MRVLKSILLLSLITVLFWQCQNSTKETSNNQVLGTEQSPSTGAQAIASFQQWLDDPQPMVSAHRGGPYPGFPENALETFQNIVDQTPAIIECDVSMTSDGVLILMHDKSLDRTTNGSGDVTDIRYDAIKNLKLVDNDGNETNFSVPTLDETLAWGKGKALFTLDVKRGVPFEKVIDAIVKHDAASYAAVITYRIRDAELVHSLNSALMISVSARDDSAIEQIVRSGIPSKNLLGFVGTSEPSSSHYEQLKQMGIKTILGTLGNLDRRAVARGDDFVYLGYMKNGADIIATDRPLEVAKVMKTELVK